MQSQKFEIVVVSISQSLPKLVFILSEASVFGARREKIVALSHARESDNIIHII